MRSQQTINATTNQNSVFLKNLGMSLCHGSDNACMLCPGIRVTWNLKTFSCCGLIPVLHSFRKQLRSVVSKYSSQFRHPCCIRFADHNKSIKQICIKSSMHNKVIPLIVNPILQELSNSNINWLDQLCTSSGPMMKSFS